MSLINSFPSGSGGSSLPNGGTSGQVLSKKTNTDGDVEWTTLPSNISTSEKGTSNGVAELDANGKVPSSQLPSYVDDVIEGYYKAANDRFYEESTFTTLIPPESGKSWVDIASNKSYRWSGSAYVRVDEGVQLGETSDTAYRGDRGKTAYNFSQAPYISTPAMDGTGSAGNSNAWARGDHVHPKDTTKADKVSGATNGNLAILNSSGNLADSGLKPGLSSSDWSSIITPLPGQHSGVKYSTSEQVIGEWIDGKTLYQKTVDFGALPDATTKSVAHSISNIDKVVAFDGFYYGAYNSSKVSVPLPYADPQLLTSCIALYVNSTNVYIITGADRSQYSAYVTIQYTKTS